MPDSRILAGAMSGTSADGIDVAVTQITGHGLDMSAELLHHHARPYERELRERIFTIRGCGAVPLAELAKLGRDISLAYAAAVNDALREANLKSSDIAAVCAHGQTLFHEVPNTIQWLDPALLAAETNCAVICDFRRADCAAGGQGAPLVPFADYILFRHQWKHRVLLNIGGIANLTFLPAQASLDEIIAFDCGPGNCLSDYLMRTFDPTGRGFDDRGRLAAKGKPIDEICFRVMKSEYFSAPWPKSTDGPNMLKIFLAACSGNVRHFVQQDLLYTAGAIVSMSIGTAIDRLPHAPDEILVSGGGSRNDFVINGLRGHLGEQRWQRVKTKNHLGFPSEAKEALAFALLGAATLDGFPSNVPSVTGAARQVVLGSITPKPQ